MANSEEEWAARTEGRIDLITREGWAAGPWDEEPDRVEWRYHGTPRFPLLIVRSFSTGALCGYVAVPPGHPEHGLGAFTIDKGRPLLGDYSVHGGVNYAEACGAFICHAPRDGESHDVWWLGFDCGHAWDIMPSLTRVRMPVELWDALKLDRNWSYKPIAYVRQEVERLAEQLARVAKGLPPEEQP